MSDITKYKDSKLSPAQLKIIHPTNPSTITIKSDYTRPGEINAENFHLGSKINAIKFIKGKSYNVTRKSTGETKEIDHWELYFLNTETKTRIKIDLVKSCYRIIYDAATPDVLSLIRTIDLNPGIELGTILSAVEAIAQKNGAWNGDFNDESGEGYNCQDFVNRLLKRLNIPTDWHEKYKFSRQLEKARATGIYKNYQLKAAASKQGTI